MIEMARLDIVGKLKNKRLEVAYHLKELTLAQN
jgi:hypothetical protein